VQPADLLAAFDVSPRLKYQQWHASNRLETPTDFGASRKRDVSEQKLNALLRNTWLGR
jgi:hypothetical protein